jgi:hypothetical protein
VRERFDPTSSVSGRKVPLDPNRIGLYGSEYNLDDARYEREMLSRHDAVKKYLAAPVAEVLLANNELPNAVGDFISRLINSCDPMRTKQHSAHPVLLYWLSLIGNTRPLFEAK